MSGRRWISASLALGLVASGCATTGRSPHTRSASIRASRQVTLTLSGGGTPAPRSACRMHGLYRTYSLGGFVSYRGRVVPPPLGNWTVKVKLKRCAPHGFSETFFEHVRGRQDGAFSGIVPKLNPNEYYVRADYEGSDGTVRSRLAFFRTVGRGRARPLPSFRE